MNDPLRRALETALPLVPRMLSLLDRNPASDTFGCFDRAWWYYKLDRTFPAATFQQHALSLAALIAAPAPPSSDAGPLREWLAASMRFWASIQHRDGSFAEWFPGERSHVATAFTLAAQTEALLLLRDADVPFTPPPMWLRAVERAARWLADHIDTVVLNHTAGAVAALANAGIITGQPAFTEAARSQTRYLAARQDPEGWFPEYDGPDIGYTSVTAAFLARYARRSADDTARDMLHRAFAFLEPFINPDGTGGGEYGSRNTRYLLPSGLVIASPDSLPARRILHRWAEGTLAGRTLTPAAADDRYFSFFFLPDWLYARACVHSCEPAQTPPGDRTAPLEPRCEYLPRGGLFVIQRPAYRVCGSAFKGGALQVWTPAGTWEDSGFLIEYDGGRRATTQWYNPRAAVTWHAGDPPALDIETPLARLPDPARQRALVLPLLIAARTLAPLPGAMAALAAAMKKRYISRHTPAPGCLHRRIVFHDDAILIDDHIDFGGPVRRWFRLRDVSLRHVPSASCTVGAVASEPLPAPRRHFALLRQRIRFDNHTPVHEYTGVP